MSLHNIRRDYQGQPIEPGSDPWDLLQRWVADALAAGEVEPTAFTLATIDDFGRPQGRIVLLKDFSPAGLVFFTSSVSAKGRQLARHPVASASFWWPVLMRQIRAIGPVADLTRTAVEEYFASRPRASQLSAWASQQSQPVANRDELERAYQEAEQRFAGGDVPCPLHWAGYVLQPDEMEFWQGLPGRLHDRALFTRDGTSWAVTRLQP